MVGCTLEAIARHEEEHSQLEKSLEDQHVRIFFFLKKKNMKITIYFTVSFFYCRILFTPFQILSTLKRKQLHPEDRHRLLTARNLRLAKMTPLKTTVISKAN